MKDESLNDTQNTQVSNIEVSASVPPTPRPNQNHSIKH